MSNLPAVTSDFSLGLRVESLSGRATHYLARTLTGRRFLVPVSQKSLMNIFLFFGVSEFVALISCFLNFTNVKKHFFIDSDLFNSSGICTGHSVFYIGTDGPFQKYTVLDTRFFSNSTCKDFKFVTKVACSPRAAELIRMEAYRLKDLCRFNGLKGAVPEFVSEGGGNGWSWVSQSICTKGFRSAINIRSDVPTFLKILHGSTRVVHKRFIEVNCRRVILNKYIKLKSFIGSVWVARIEHSIAYLDDNSLADSGYVYAHRDLTKWNIKFLEDRIFVFDWEYSDIEYPELYDLIHYLVFPKIIRRQRFAKSNCVDLDFFIESAKKAASDLCLTDQVNVIWQVLFYLLDVCLFYIDANNGVTDDLVIESYASIIDEILIRD